MFLMSTNTTPNTHPYGLSEITVDHIEAAIAKLESIRDATLAAGAEGQIPSARQIRTHVRSVEQMMGDVSCWLDAKVSEEDDQR